MSQDKNPFGGLNPHGLYVPMSEVEQEVVARLVEAGDLKVVVVGWGVVNKPRITFGDARLQVVFRLNFNRPAFPMDVYYFDLELRTGADVLLFKQRYPTTYDAKPISVAAGVFLDYVWDIAIQNIDPKLVKTIKPGALGLTSRLQDKDTGQITRTGNMRLSTKDRRLLEIMRTGEKVARQDTQQRVQKAKKDSGES
jgi:hypothetical protein